MLWDKGVDYELPGRCIDLAALSLIPICRGSTLWQLIFTAIFWSGLAQLVALEFTSGGFAVGENCC